MIKIELDANSESDIAILRLLATKVLNQAVGHRHHDEDIFEDVVFEYPWVDVETLATKRVNIVDGFWGQSRTSGSNAFYAFTIGTGTWYVFHLEATDECEFVATISEQDQYEEFAKFTKQWIWDCGPAYGTFPTEFECIHQHEPWFAREMVNAVQPVADLLEEHTQTIYEYRSNLFSVWTRYVTRTSPTGKVQRGVPGLNVGDPEVARSRYGAWLKTVELRWRDTQELLTHDEAQCLRLVCAFVTA